MPDALPLPTLLGSALAGMLAKIPCHPIDTIKSRVQARPDNLSAGPPRISTVLSSTMRSEGVRGLYRGFGIAFFGSAPATCLYFTSYEAVKKVLLEEGEPAGDGTSSKRRPLFASAPALGHFFAGIAAETLSCVLWVPIDVVKERMQVQRRRQEMQGSSPGIYYRNTFDAFRQIMKSEGVVGLYRGYGATIASFGPFSALYFVFYEQAKKWAQQRHLGDAAAATTTASGASKADEARHEQLPLHWQILTASFAGSAASLATNPLDLAKLRLQVQRGVLAANVASSSPTTATATAPATTHYRHTLHALGVIVKEEGALALFRGAGARMAFHAPSTAITMTLFERCKALMEKLLKEPKE